MPGRRDEAGLTSVLAAPLYARGELLGVMSLALSRLTDREDHNYDPPDRDLIGAIASRVAIAIDNSMLFEAERQTALAFQNSLLPQAIPELDGLEVAFRYVPAKPLAAAGQGIQTQVGGDWYDIIPLAVGRVGIVIGDVEGRARGPRPSWARSARRCGPSPRTRSPRPTSCASWTSGAGRSRPPTAPGSRWPPTRPPRAAPT